MMPAHEWNGWGGTILRFLMHDDYKETKEKEGIAGRRITGGIVRIPSKIDSGVVIADARRRTQMKS